MGCTDSKESVKVISKHESEAPKIEGKNIFADKPAFEGGWEADIKERHDKMHEGEEEYEQPEPFTMEMMIEWRPMMNGFMDEINEI